LYYAETLKLPKEFKVYIKNDLKVVNPAFREAAKANRSTKGIKSELNFYTETKDYIEVPRMYRNNAIPMDNLIDATTWANPKDHLEFAAGKTLRENQSKAMEAIIDANGNLIIEMPTGSGKTVTGISAITHFKRRALVLVHKKSLMNQWKEAFNEFSNAKVGLLGSGKMEISEQYDVVIATVQSIQPYHKKKYTQLVEADFFNSFDVVIVDEAHNFSAETFYQCISKFPAKIRIGFSATAFRNDGLDFVFKLCIGKPFKIEMEQEIKPKIWECYTGWEDRTHSFYNRRNANLATALTKMTQDSYRNKMLYRCLNTMGKNDRKTLFLTCRVDHARMFYKNMVKLFPKKEVCLLIGASKDEERQKAKTADFVFATYGVAKEGVDLPLLDTLIFATPIAGRSGVIQAVGRLTRKKEGKNENVDVYDFIDDSKVFKAFFYKRRVVYSEMGLESNRLNMKRLKWI